MVYVAMTNVLKCRDVESKVSYIGVCYHIRHSRESATNIRGLFDGT